MIYCETIEELTEICTRLYHESITFEAFKFNGRWRIELRGF
jgi:hypothetical protein